MHKSFLVPFTCLYLQKAEKTVSQANLWSLKQRRENMFRYGEKAFSNESYQDIQAIGRGMLLLLLLLSYISRVRLCNPIVSSPPGSSVSGTLQAGILEWVAISFSIASMHAKLLQSCPTLCDPMNSSPPGSSVHRVLQARILKWVAISFSRKRNECRSK